MDGVAAALVGRAGAAVTTVDDGRLDALFRTAFYKMSGSGNDFVFFDARAAGTPGAVPPDRVAAICARGTGVGADGLVLLDQPGPGQVRIAYFNSDGSRAALCGNATLCTASLAVYLDAVAPDADFVIVTDAGALRARVSPDGAPSFELDPVRELRLETADALAGCGGAAESRIGYAVVGVPHLVVRVPDVHSVDLLARAPGLRRPTPDRPYGANVNFVSPGPDRTWAMRTYERGVEAETLACGTGAVACATVLRSWGETGGEVLLLTGSGQQLTVAQGNPGAVGPVLAGEGRLVFTGTLQHAR